MDAAKADLMRALGRLARGLSTLFWGTPADAGGAVETARTDSARFFGRAGHLRRRWFSAPCCGTGCAKCGTFRGRSASGSRRSIGRRLFAIVNVGLAPFLFWWHRFPSVPFYVVVRGIPGGVGPALSHSTQPGAAAPERHAPDEMLRAGNQDVHRLQHLDAPGGDGRLVPLHRIWTASQMPDIVLGSFHFRPQERGLWLALFLTLMPVAMTMALLWKIKEAIFTGLFAVEP